MTKLFALSETVVIALPYGVTQVRSKYLSNI